MEAIGMFLYAMAGGHSVRSVNNRMVRCNATVNRYFHRVLNAVNEMANQLIQTTSRSITGLPKMMHSFPLLVL